MYTDKKGRFCYVFYSIIKKDYIIETQSAMNGVNDKRRIRA